MSGFGSSDRFNDSLDGPLIYVVASVTPDNYIIETDSCYNDYGKASDRADELELISGYNRQWEVLTCRLEN